VVSGDKTKIPFYEVRDILEEAALFVKCGEFVAVSGLEPAAILSSEI